MKISDNKVVSFHYRLTNGAGELLDDSREAEPLPYLHGHRNIIPGLEAALAGREPGDRFEVKLSPQTAYGLRDDSLVQVLERSAFAVEGPLEVGMHFEVADESDEVRMAIITAVEGDKITVDANHPLAGQTLLFDVEVMAVRDASADELARGRVELEL